MLAQRLGCLHRRFPHFGAECHNGARRQDRPDSEITAGSFCSAPGRRECRRVPFASRPAQTPFYTRPSGLEGSQTGRGNCPGRHRCAGTDVARKLSRACFEVVPNGHAFPGGGALLIHKSRQEPRR